MEVVHVKEVEERILPGHGETTLYRPILGANTSKLGLMKNITSMWVMTVKPGGTNRRHLHEDQEQVYFVLEGEGMVEVGEERRMVKVWDSVYLPPKVSHAFYNDTEASCVVLGISVKIPR